MDLAGGLAKSGQFIKYGCNGGKFITLNFHGIHNLDNYGLCIGGLKTGWDLASINIHSKLRYGVDVKWGIFDPNPIGFKEIVDLVREKKVSVVCKKNFETVNDSIPSRSNQLSIKSTNLMKCRKHTNEWTMVI